MDDKLFRSIGLKESAIKGISKNESEAKALKECILEANVANGCDGSVGKLIYSISKEKKMNNDNAKSNRKFLLEYVVNGGIKTKPQLDAAYKYISKHKPPLNSKEFEKECGVGVVVSEKEIIEAINSTIAKSKDQIAAKGYVTFLFFALIISRNFLKIKQSISIQFYQNSVSIYIEKGAMDKLLLQQRPWYLGLMVAF